MPEAGENSRFCPYCRRWLATLHDDGTFSVAAAAIVRATFDTAGGEVEELPDGTLAVTAVPAEGYEAECGRRLCRFAERHTRLAFLAAPSPVRLRISWRVLAALTVVYSLLGSYDLARGAPSWWDAWVFAVAFVFAFLTGYVRAGAARRRP